MKTNLDPQQEDTLLAAMLRDEEWQAASAAFKAEALRSFHAHHRVRRLTRWAGGAAALAVVLVSAALWLGRPIVAPRQLAVAPAAVPKPSKQARDLTDAELVAAFPKGTCFIAEVDDKKELVFFSLALQRTYMAQPETQGH